MLVMQASFHLRYQKGTTDPKMSRKKPANDPRSTSKWCQEGPKRKKKKIPNRKMNEETNEDDHMTALEPPKAPMATHMCTGPGAHTLNGA